MTQLSSNRGPLDPFFTPSSVALIGATETDPSVSRTILTNLGLFHGKIYPVNPKRDQVLGRKAYPSIREVPAAVDLAVIVTPAATVPSIVAECAAANVPAAIVISAGFKETGEQGAVLEREILAKRGAMRIVGPNCLGVMSPQAGLNATFSGAMALPGSIGFLSQSGALCTAILDWSLREMVGFSAFVSTGSMLDVGWGDLIDYLGDDPNTRAILIYMESIGDARSFLSAAREVALSKPIIVIKAGRSDQAAAAASSHTGALTGSDEVLDAALRRSGVLRVDRISDLFYMAEVLAKQPRPKGPRLLIVTNAGGPGVLATDALIAEGGELAELSAETIAKLDQVLPAHWSHRNPVDIIGDATAERFAQTLAVVKDDPEVDGLLVTLTPQGLTSPTQVAESMRPFAHLTGKPVLASWMGGAGVARGEEILNAAGIPTFLFPDSAARAFAYMWHYSYNLRALYETPELSPASVDRQAARAVFEAARAENRTLLTEHESKQVLAAYAIPVTRAELAETEDSAAKFAKEIGFPVVVKLHSRTITHKTDVGGVDLDLRDEAQVRAAFQRMRTRVGDGFDGVTVQPMIRAKDGYELILGSSVDAQFGPVLLFGLGGQLVEVFRDRALGLPPLNSTLARRMMEHTKIYQALGGVRGRAPVDRAVLEQILVRFSQLVAESPRIKEIDINPLLASPTAIVALDARVVLHDWTIPDRKLPRTTIRPYPSAWTERFTTRDGSPVTIRPIRPEDEPAMVRFHETLSERSVYFRYFHHMSLTARVTHERLTRICFIDYDREMVLVVESTDGEIIAVGRLTRERTSGEAEFALLVSDTWHEHGLGTELLSRLVLLARNEGITRVSGDILAENRAMQDICRQLGFDLRYSVEDGVVRASIAVTVPPS
ncbi:MAG TPA: bifunctional acetate--CoA ligase family protein/GNAT family N-acetyltransferase [Bryobacteraceae bacterium]|nr:bifunctional acetate--CoA ligase family protein/GNAT family N-acetyltransferase [Bryobacteraceae bacterium]